LFPQAANATIATRLAATTLNRFIHFFIVKKPPQSFSSGSLTKVSNLPLVTITRQVRYVKEKTLENFNFC
ncbi:MAG: hypothetical protein E7I21_00590, partial [Limosilactobacillus fermentum]|nr:hypothetical protein [Limosilactobacillus fermentum]